MHPHLLFYSSEGMTPFQPRPEVVVEEDCFELERLLLDMLEQALELPYILRPEYALRMGRIDSNQLLPVLVGRIPDVVESEGHSHQSSSFPAGSGQT